MTDFFRPLRHSRTHLTNSQGYMGIQPHWPATWGVFLSTFDWDAYILCPRYRRAGHFVLEEHTVIRHFYRSPYANTKEWFCQSWFWRITVNKIYSKCLGAFMSEDSYIGWRVKRPQGWILTYSIQWCCFVVSTILFVCLLTCLLTGTSEKGFCWPLADVHDWHYFAACYRRLKLARRSQRFSAQHWLELFYCLIGEASWLSGVTGSQLNTQTWC